MSTGPVDPNLYSAAQGQAAAQAAAAAAAKKYNIPTAAPADTGGAYDWAADPNHNPNRPVTADTPSIYSPANATMDAGGNLIDLTPQQQATAQAGVDNWKTTLDAAQPTPTSGPGSTPTSDTTGQHTLQGPGPLEQWSAANSGAFDNPTAAESLYSSHGSDLMNTPSASETLFSQGMGQMDPYYSYAQDKATRSINDAAAARGNWNSSNATNNIRDSAANLYGQQAMQMGARASAADSAKLGRYAATEGMAGNADSGYGSRVAGAENLYGGWQQAQENRLGGAQNTATQLAQGQANTITNAYKTAGDLSNQDNLEAFNAQLQKLGIDPKSSAVQDFIKALGAGGSIATALA